MRPRRRVVAGIACAILAIGCANSTAPLPGTSVGIQLATSDASPGDTLVFLITFGHADRPGDPLDLELSFDGGQPALDTTRIPPADSSLVVGLVLPTNLPNGTISITATLPTEHDKATAQVTVRAAFRPVLGEAGITGYGPGPHPFSGQRGQLFALAGTQEQLNISATDSVDLSYVGWMLGPPANLADSVAVSSSTASWNPVITIPANLAGTAPELIEFARNSVGQRVAVSWGPMGIGQYLDRPVASAPVDTSVHEMVADTKRNVVYLATRDQSSIAVASIPGLAPQTSIPLPGPPQSLDLTPGGDTLVVGLLGTANLALIDLATPGRPTTVVPVTSLVGNGVISRIRVPSNNRVIVEATNSFLAHYDLNTGLDAIDVSGAFNDSTMARTGDANRIVFPNVGYPPQSAKTWATFYDAKTNTYFSASGAHIYPLPNVEPTADQHGQYYMIQQYVFDSTFALLGWLAYTPSGSTVSAISPSNDTDAFLTVCDTAGCTNGPWYYARFAIPGPSDTIANAPIGQLLELVNAPAYASTLLATPDGRTLIGLGANTLMAFDLTQSSPASFAHVARAPSRAPVQGVARPQPRLFVHLHAL